ncbi:MAG: hypothetical protein AB7P02_28710 [Alphaproteobacteria bacterium]
MAQTAPGGPDPWSYLTENSPGRSGVVAVKSYGPGFPSLEGGPVATHAGAMSPEVKKSVGCLVTGVAATALSLSAGSENLVNLIAGGIVQPANATVLYIGVFGVVFASFCAIGQAVTPLYLHFFDGDANGKANAPASVQCPTCRPRDRESGVRRARGPLSGELRRAAAAQAEVVIAATGSTTDDATLTAASLAAGRQ